MAKIFEYGGITICVYPNDHSPIHCHVFVGESELRVFLPEYNFELKAGKTPNMATLKKVLEAVKNNRNLIGKEWRRFHGN